jgi:hypothetical protein
MWPYASADSGWPKSLDVKHETPMSDLLAEQDIPTADPTMPCISTQSGASSSKEDRNEARDCFSRIAEAGRRDVSLPLFLTSGRDPALLNLRDRRSMA